MPLRTMFLASLMWMAAVGLARADALPCAVQGKVTLVDFTAAWCGPCKVQKPIVQALARELGDRAAVVIVDIDKDRRAKAYKVSSIPTLVFHDAAGAVRFRHTGIMGREAILAKLNEIGLPDAGETPAAATSSKTGPRNTLTVY